MLVLRENGRERTHGCLRVPHLAEHARCRPLLVQALTTGLNSGVVRPLVLVQRGEESTGAAAAADCG